MDLPSQSIPVSVPIQGAEPPAAQPAGWLGGWGSYLPSGYLPSWRGPAAPVSTPVSTALREAEPAVPVPAPADSVPAQAACSAIATM